MILGYLITASVLSAFVLLIASIAMGRREIYEEMRQRVNRYTLAFLAAALVFFVVFALYYVHPTEQLYFDENIYQGIAMNILRHGNALWCQFGTAYLNQCYINQLYHDPAGWPVFIAMAFAVFGIGTNTAFALELAMGALSVVAVFLLASVLFDRKAMAVLSTFVFVLMPELFVWARTQADIDLPFMVLITFAFFFFVLFTRRRTRSTLAMFAFSMLLAVYTRTEGILLLPIFALLMLAFGSEGVVKTVKERAEQIAGTMADDFKTLLVLLAFLLVLMTQLYYISFEARNPAFGQPQGQGVLTIADFKTNIGTNLNYIFGLFGEIRYYPAIFPIAITPLAILGAAIFAIRGKESNRFGKLLLLGAWFLAYFLFYTFFYAGGATFGVDARFMLQILPSISILAALAICELADVASGLMKSRRFAVFAAASVVLAAALVLYPFTRVLPNVTVPTANMPLQAIIHPSMDFFYDNYNSIPTNCLVFSFTSDIWWEVNRSSAQINYVFGANSTISDIFKNYSCFAFDSGYWCTVPPNRDSTCKQVVTTYATQTLSEAPVGNGWNASYYKLLDYAKNLH